MPGLEVASDSRSQVAVPAGWHGADVPSSEVSLFLESTDRTASIAISSYDKEPGLTLSEYAEGLGELILKSVNGASRVAPPRMAPASNFQAVIAPFKVRVGDGDVALLHVTLEGPRYFHQLMLNSRLSTLRRDEAILIRILESFREP